MSTWNAKWAGRLQGAVVAAGLGPQRRAQQRLFSYALSKRPPDQEAFFREFFSLDRRAREVLETAGLLQRYDVDVATASPLGLAGEPSALPDEGRLVVRPPDARPTDFQFALVCDRRFVKPTFATMTSVLATMGPTGSVRFVVLGDGLAPADVLRLRALEHTAFDVEVVVHDITADLDRDVGREDPKRATFGRIYLIDHLPVQRTVYLDGDVLATRQLTELFESDLGDACLAGVPDSAALRLVVDPARVPVEQRNRLLGVTHGDPLEYLNGGVLVLALENPDFRSLALEARSLVVLHGRALKQRDQDALNIAFSGRKHRLESTYNYMTQFFVSDRCLGEDLVRRKYDCADATLIHFSGRVKPWESAEEEFYNGLYRQLVVEAERRVGVSCGFYFSAPDPLPKGHWTADRWKEALASGPAKPQATDAMPDCEVVALADDGAYLCCSPALHRLALAGGLSLVAWAGGTLLLQVPFDRLGSPLTHLSEHGRHAVRKLPFDLASALAGHGGVARDVVLALGRDPVPSRLVRVIGGADLVAAGPAATRDLLATVQADGLLESFEGGRLAGWYRPGAGGWDDTLALYVGDTLMAVQQPGATAGERDGHTRPFVFEVSPHLHGEDGGRGAVSVRAGRRNVPLPGSPLVVVDPLRDLRFETTRRVWVKQRRYVRELLRSAGPRVRNPTRSGRAG